MKRSLLALCIATSLPANAVYNLYNADGMTFDINGQINIQAAKSDNNFTVLQDNAVFVGDTNKKGTFELTDKRARLGQDFGASWMEFRGATKMNNGVRASATVGLAFDYQNQRGFLESNYIALDKQNLGAILIGRQFLHTGYVQRSGTFNTLDVQVEKGVRVDYTGIKGLQASGYYAFSENNDEKQLSANLWTKGYGASASYKTDLGENGSVRLAAGATTHSARTKSTTSPAKVDGLLASAEYRNGRYLAAVDGGRQILGFNDARNLIKTHTSDFVGAKVGMELTPQWVFTAGAGIQQSKMDHGSAAKGKSADEIAKLMKGKDAQGADYVAELYDNVNRKRAYVRADYFMRESVRFYGRADFENTSYKLLGKEYINSKNPEYRVGVTISF